MARKPTYRRQPVQRRSLERVERILDAADAEFAEKGYEQGTTNAIAARADTSIGSVYLFFADKDAILQALATRYRDRLHAVHDAVLNEETARLPLPEAYDRVIGALADFYRTNPGFRSLFHGSVTSASLAEAAQLLHQECIDRVDVMLAVRMPGLCPVRRRGLATLNVEVMKALLPLSEGGDEQARAETLAALKHMLLGYMQSVMGPQP